MQNDVEREKKNNNNKKHQLDFNSGCCWMHVLVFWTFFSRQHNRTETDRLKISLFCWCQRLPVLLFLVCFILLLIKLLKHGLFYRLCFNFKLGNLCSKKQPIDDHFLNAAQSDLLMPRDVTQQKQIHWIIKWNQSLSEGLGSVSSRVFLQDYCN